MRNAIHYDMNGHMQVNEVILPSAPIRSLEALRALVDSQRHRIVTMLMERALTAREIADRLGIGRTRLYYHLAMLEQHGIIYVADTRVVSGILERRYRAAARTFRVDRALLSGTVSDEDISDAQASIMDAVAADLHANILSQDANMLAMRAFLRLNDARRRELRDRLTALVDEYRDPDSGGNETEVALALFKMEGPVE